MKYFWINLCNCVAPNCISWSSDGPTELSVRVCSQNKNPRVTVAEIAVSPGQLCYVPTSTIAQYCQMKTLLGGKAYKIEARFCRSRGGECSPKMDSTATTVPDCKFIPIIPYACVLFCLTTF